MPVAKASNQNGRKRVISIYQSQQMHEGSRSVTREPEASL